MTSSSRVKGEIEKREHAIKMYGYDVWGSDAASNVDKMKSLRKEIWNLERYGHPNPSWFYRAFNGYSKRLHND